MRRAAGETADAVSVKTQISRWENGRITRPSLTVVAQAFDSTPEALFGLPPGQRLPRPVLLAAHVTSHTVELLSAQRLVHAMTEHTLGPAMARALVASDLATVEGLLKVTPEALNAEMHSLAALIAELGGWIAQETGRAADALTLTCRAHSYAPRWANLVTTTDPRLAATLLERAISLVPGQALSRLQAAIARQQAHTAAVLRDASDFGRHADRAAEQAQAPVAARELAPYADAAHITSETASGLILLDRAEAAASLLADHVSTWAAGQERDHAVALARTAAGMTSDAHDDMHAGELETSILLAACRAATPH